MKAVALALALAFATGVFGGGAWAQRRIVGGQTITVQTAPWVVHVQYQDAPNSFYHCTGSIIDSTHVLTAAHCLYNDSAVLAQPSQMTVHAGTSNFYSPVPGDALQVRGVTSIRVHPRFVPGATADRDDIAVLALDAPLDLAGPTAHAIALPSASQPASDVMVAGYGRQEESTPSDGQLASMAGSVEPQGDCGAFGSTITNTNGVILCVASAASTACFGDSGAGVVTPGPTPVLIGVVDRLLTTGCAPGSDVLAARLSAPEILRFVEGDDEPPLAPRSAVAARLTWKRPLVVGGTVVCSAGRGWQGVVGIAYTFMDASSGRVLQTGSRPAYRVRSMALHRRIACRALVTNGGGTLLVKTAPTQLVVAPPRRKH